VAALPIMLPALFIGLRATLLLSTGAGVYDIWRLILFLIIYDLIFITIAFWAFDTALID